MRGHMVSNSNCLEDSLLMVSISRFITYLTTVDFCRGFNKVYVCRLVDAKPWMQTPRLVGEFGARTAGGRLAAVPLPASGWRGRTLGQISQCPHICSAGPGT